MTLRRITQTSYTNKKPEREQRCNSSQAFDKTVLTYWQKANIVDNQQNYNDNQE